MNICKIESIIPGKPWNSAHGQMFAFTIVFADGIRGEANAKTNPPPYKVGDKVGYEIAGTTPLGANKLRIDRKADPALCKDTTPPEAPDFEAAVPRPAPAPSRTPPPAQAPRSVPQNAPVNGQTVGMAVKLAGDMLLAQRPDLLGHGNWANELRAVASHIIAVSQSLETDTPLDKILEESSVPF